MNTKNLHTIYHFIETKNGQIVRYVNKLIYAEPAPLFTESCVRLITKHQFDVLHQYKHKIDNIPAEVRNNDDEISLLVNLVKLGESNG